LLTTLTSASDIRFLGNSTFFYSSTATATATATFFLAFFYAFFATFAFSTAFRLPSFTACAYCLVSSALACRSYSLRACS
jgi:hypothetical protein